MRIIRSFFIAWFYGVIGCLIIILLWMAKKNENTDLFWNSSINSTSNRYESGYVTLDSFRGRLGNQMFEFIALFYVALKTNREVVLFDGHNGHELEKYFSLRVRIANTTCPCFILYPMLQSYDSRVEKIARSENATKSRTIVLRGFFQSWNYLEPVESMVLSHMKFLNTIEVFARDNLRENIPKGWTEGQFTRVGIHNRRGDFLNSKWTSYGITTAPESYFRKAMKYFVDRDNRSIQFIVVSDDIIWSREHITYDNQSVSVNVTYSERHSPGQDMAILSLCDHVIMSTGTFGWMAGWLANGTTVYYSNYPRNGTRLARGLHRHNYFPPHWIPME